MVFSRRSNEEGGSPFDNVLTLGATVDQVAPSAAGGTYRRLARHTRLDNFNAGTMIKPVLRRYLQQEYPCKQDAREVASSDRKQERHPRAQHGLNIVEKYISYKYAYYINSLNCRIRFAEKLVDLHESADDTTQLSVPQSTVRFVLFRF